MPAPLSGNIIIVTGEAVSVALGSFGVRLAGISWILVFVVVVNESVDLM